jgi:hypothetical protein
LTIPSHPVGAASFFCQKMLLIGIERSSGIYLETKKKEFLINIQAVVSYSTLRNDGVPFITDVLALKLNAPDCRLFSTLGLTAPWYDDPPPTLFP